MARARALSAGRALVSSALVLGGRAVGAQTLPYAVRSDPSLRPNVGVTAVVATHPIGLASVSVERDAGLYARVGLVASGGTSTADGGHTVGEVAAIGRFLLDPLRQQAHGIYATGGLALRIEHEARPRPFILAGLGVEGRPLGHILPALEAGLGGGARVGVVLRPLRANRR